MIQGKFTATEVRPTFEGSSAKHVVLTARPDAESVLAETPYNAGAMPFGSLILQVDNEKATGDFDAGADYVVTIERADKYSARIKREQAAKDAQTKSAQDATQTPPAAK